MSIFKYLRDKKNWTLYQAAKELGVSYGEYLRLEEGTNGERFVRYMHKMQSITDTTTGEIKKVLKDTSKKK